MKENGPKWEMQWAWERWLGAHGRINQPIDNEYVALHENHSGKAIFIDVQRHTERHDIDAVRRPLDAREQIVWNQIWDFLLHPVNLLIP